MNLYNLCPNSWFRKLETLAGFKLIERDDERLEFKAVASEINGLPPQRIFEYEGHLWEVGLPSVNVIKPTVFYFKAVRLYKTVLRGNVQQCEGMRFLMPELTDLFWIGFTKDGQEKRAIFIRGHHFESGSPIVEGDCQVYFFDGWK